MDKGDKFEESFVISTELHGGFIDLFSDKNPMHTDIAFAKSKGFNSVIMHGNILGGFLSYFVGECLPNKNIIILSQNMNFHNPFFIGDELTLNAIIREVHNSVGISEIKYRFRNQLGVIISKGTLQIKHLN